MNKIQGRLDENLTRQGINRGKPLSESNRYQLAQHRKNLESHIHKLSESVVGNNFRISVLAREKRTTGSP